MDVELRLSPDRMQAVVSLPADLALDEEGLRILLERHGVRYGISETVTKSVQMKAMVDRTLVIAAGSPPVHGRDARIEVLVAEPLAKLEGTVDLRDQHHFREVTKGTPLLRLIAPESGTPGMNVRGDLVPPKTGRALDLSPCIGPGCERDEKEPSLVLAQLDGIYQRFIRGGRPYVQVLTSVEVPGNLDLTVGNIDTRFPVVVHGDVLATFTLRAGSNLTVDGALEDAEVSVHGDCLVRGGILPGGARVKVGGDLQARHIHGRQVRCRNALVDHGVLNADVVASNDIEAKEVVGGSLVAGGHIRLDELGDASGTTTMVEAGVDPYSSLASTMVTKRKPEVETEVIRTKEQCRLLAHRVQQLIAKGEDHQHEDARLREVLEGLDRLRRERSGLLEVQRKHTERLARVAQEQITQEVRISRVVHPGVTIRIGPDAAFVVDQPYKRVRFRREGKRVVVEPLF